jgi:hypothetical protein
VDPAAVRAQFIKLLPAVAVKATPGDGPDRAITRIEALFWLDTPAHLDLGVTALLTHQVAITAHVQSVAWDFGDGTTTTSTGPGKPFTSTDSCATPTCPGWFGHTYTSVGSVTVKAIITWTGQYQVDGGPVLDIAGTVTTTAVSFPVQILEARAILVPTPTSH